jgi:hypothetical protein
MCAWVALIGWETGKINIVARIREQVVFVVPFFLNGYIDKMRVYSDVMKAQAALRRWVNYRELIGEVKRAHPGIDRKRAMMRAYGAIDRTPFAGTCVYEVAVDSRERVRKSEAPRLGSFKAV